MTLHTQVITHFDFEADFVEDNIRCIPMIVRYKLDACGIKLKLSEWSKMNSYEREMLTLAPCNSDIQITRYRKYLEHLVFYRTGQSATPLPPVVNPSWSVLSMLPAVLEERLKETGHTLSLKQWQRLEVLQRFALVKLCSSGHEHKNFSKALKEFNLL